MAISEERVREELKKVIDPELFVNIVDLGLVYVVELKPAAGVDSDSSKDSPSSPLTSEGVAVPKSDAPTSEIAAAGETPDRSEILGTGAESVVDDATGISEPVEKVDVVIDMTMTSPACPAGPQLIANSKQVVGRMEGVRNVEVRIVMDPPWTPDRMTEDARDHLGIF